MKNKKHYYSWIHPNLEVRNITSSGKGVFAKKKIRKDKILVIFGGYIFTREEELTFRASMNDYAHHITSEFVIGVRKKKDLQPVDYINHSCEPNVGFKGQIFLVAMRDINKDEQITFDYCMVLSKPKKVKEIYSFICECGSKNCRKIVTWNDWKKPFLQKKYKGYFQWYLSEKIKDSKKSK